MCTVMIVENRFTTRDWLRECIKNSNIKYNKIILCKSSSEALEYIAKNKVDIVITRLQKMDSACVEIARVLKKKILFSIVLGYGSCKDFNFLCNAVNCGISKYLEDVFDKDKLEVFLNEAYEMYSLNRLHLSYIEKIATAKSESVYSNIMLKEWVDGYTRNVVKNSYKSIDQYINFISEIMDNQKLCQSKSLILELMIIFNDKIDKGNLYSDYVILNSKDCCTFMNINTVEQLKKMFQTYMNRLAKNIYMSTTVKDHKSQTIIVAKDYIKKNYYKDISRDDVANAVYLNPSYFSKIFKEQMGESFVSYLRRIRMVAAMDYLENSTHSIKDISTRVGYIDSKYFSRLFYKHTGYTPCDYRKCIVKLMA